MCGHGVCSHELTCLRKVRTNFKEWLQFPAIYLLLNVFKCLCGLLLWGEAGVFVGNPSCPVWLPPTQLTCSCERGLNPSCLGEKFR